MNHGNKEWFNYYGIECDESISNANTLGALRKTIATKEKDKIWKQWSISAPPWHKQYILFNPSALKWA